MLTKETSMARLVFWGTQWLADDTIASGRCTITGTDACKLLYSLLNFKRIIQKFGASSRLYYKIVVGFWVWQGLVPNYLLKIK